MCQRLLHSPGKQEGAEQGQRPLRVFSERLDVRSQEGDLGAQWLPLLLNELPEF